MSINKMLCVLYNKICINETDMKQKVEVSKINGASGNPFMGGLWVLSASLVIPDRVQVAGSDCDYSGCTLDIVYGFVCVC